MPDRIQVLLDELEIGIAAGDRDGCVRLPLYVARELVRCAMEDGARDPLVTDLVLEIPIEYPNPTSAIGVARLTSEEARLLRRHAKRSLVREELRLARIAEADPDRSIRASDEGESSSELPKPRNNKRRGRRKPVPVDRNFDQRVFRAWATSDFATYAELARELNVPERELRLACDRERKREEKAEKARQKAARKGIRKNP